MCGIVYAWRKDGHGAAKRVIRRYKRQADRGSDGFGYVALADDNSVMEYRRYQKEKETLEALKKSASKHILFHHRFPTSTVNVPEAAHPILVKHPELKHSYYVVHNGVLTDYDWLHDEHIEKGYKYTTEIRTQYKTKKTTYYGDSKYNDSEVLAIELARTIEGLQERVRSRGSIAYIALQCDKAGKNVKAVYYGTNGGNPLTVTDDDAGIVLASEGGERISANLCYRHDLKSGEITHPDVPLPYYSYGGYSSSSGGYSGKYGYWDAEGVYHSTSGHYTEIQGYKKDDERTSDDEKDEKEASEADFTPEDEYDEWSDIDNLEAQLQEIDWNMEIAEQSGSWEEYDRLEEEREILMDALLEAKGETRTIGF